MSITTYVQVENHDGPLCFVRAEKMSHPRLCSDYDRCLDMYIY